MDCGNLDNVFYVVFTGTMVSLLIAFIAFQIWFDVKLGGPQGLPLPPKRREYETTNKKAS